jgi:hypothetical protein
MSSERDCGCISANKWVRAASLLTCRRTSITSNLAFYAKESNPASFLAHAMLCLTSGIFRTGWRMRCSENPVMICFPYCIQYQKSSFIRSNRATVVVVHTVQLANHTICAGRHLLITFDVPFLQFRHPFRDLVCAERLGILVFYLE